MKFGHTALAVAVASIAAATPAWAQTPQSGGTLAFAVSAEPPNFDCHAQSSFAFIHPVRPHYSTLLKFDTANYPKVVGDLAESWTLSPDGLTFTFKLRQGVKFHDGSAFSSADIKATYERLRNPPQGVRSLRVESYADIDSHRYAGCQHRRLQAVQAECVDARQLRIAAVSYTHLTLPTN